MRLARGPLGDERLLVSKAAKDLLKGRFVPRSFMAILVTRSSSKGDPNVPGGAVERMLRRAAVILGDNKTYKSLIDNLENLRLLSAWCEHDASWSGRSQDTVVLLLQSRRSAMEENSDAPAWQPLSLPSSTSLVRVCLSYVQQSS